MGTISPPDAPRNHERVLIHAPYGRDGVLIDRALRVAGIASSICADVQDLCLEMTRGAGAALVADEALNPHSVECFQNTLLTQPPWSDFPLLVLTCGGEPTEASRRRLLLLGPLGNVTLLERPLRAVTLVSSLRAALRSRNRQYQMRDYLREREESERMLRETDQRLWIAIETAHMGAWTLDLATGHMEASPRCKANFGWPLEKPFDYADLSALIVPEDREMVKTAVERALAHQSIYEAEYRVRLPGQSIRWIRASGRGIYNDRGVAARMTGVTLDSTAQKLAQAELRASEERFRTLVESNPSGVILSNAEGVLQYANAAALVILGYSREEISAGEVSWSGITPAEWHDADVEAQSQLAVSGRWNPFEKECISKSGERVSILVSGSVLFMPDGESVIAAYITDLTEQRIAEETIREGERQFATLADSIPQLAWMATPEGFIFWYNQRWYDYTGTTVKDMIGANWDSIYGPKELPRLNEQWDHSIRAGEPLEIESLMRGADGVYRWFLTRMIPLHTVKGKVARWFGTHTDINELRRAGGALEKANAELRRANQDLEQFAYSASHDLQEPLRMVAIYSQLIKQKYAHSLDEDTATYVGFLVRGAHQMEMLLKDLLSYAQATNISADPIKMTDSGVVLARVVASMKSSLEQTGTTIHIGPMPHLPVHEAHLVQLFQNLLSNATKYRAETAPRIAVAAERQGKFWLFSVRDNGIGIEAKYATHVFGIFKRLHGQKYPGTGIGLAICSKIVERYGGRIWVESEVGAGSVFYFTLPVKAEQVTEASALLSGVNSHSTR